MKFFANALLWTHSFFYNVRSNCIVLRNNQYKCICFSTSREPLSKRLSIVKFDVSLYRLKESLSTLFVIRLMVTMRWFESQRSRLSSFVIRRINDYLRKISCWFEGNERVFHKCVSPMQIQQKNNWIFLAITTQLL